MVHRLWVFVRTLLGTDHRPADIDHLGMIVVLHFLGLWDGINTWVQENNMPPDNNHRASLSKSPCPSNTKKKQYNFSKRKARFKHEDVDQAHLLVLKTINEDSIFEYINPLHLLGLWLDQHGGQKSLLLAYCLAFIVRLCTQTTFFVATASYRKTDCLLGQFMACRSGTQREISARWTIQIFSSLRNWSKLTLMINLQEILLVLRSQK